MLQTRCGGAGAGLGSVGPHPGRPTPPHHKSGGRRCSAVGALLEAGGSRSRSRSRVPSPLPVPRRRLSHAVTPCQGECRGCPREEGGLGILEGGAATPLVL